MTWILLLLGILLIFAGRNLFWLFVSGMGFLAGLTAAPLLFRNMDSVMIVLLSIACGLVGLLLAQFVQKLGAALAGFLAGAYVLDILMKLFLPGMPPNNWFFHVFAGLVGAVMVLSFFEWALVILTSLSGATLVTQSLQVPAAWSALILLLLLIVGVSIQGTFLERSRRAAAPEKRKAS